MADKRTKRVFAGFYERYDHVIIHVAMVIDDVDTGDKIVIFNYEGTRADGKNHSMRLDVVRHIVRTGILHFKHF